MIETVKVPVYRHDTMEPVFIVEVPSEGLARVRSGHSSAIVSCAHFMAWKDRRVITPENLVEARSDSANYYFAELSPKRGESVLILKTLEVVALQSLKNWLDCPDRWERRRYVHHLSLSAKFVTQR